MTGRFRGMYLCKRGLNRSEFAPPRFTIILNRRFNYGYGLWTFVAPIKTKVTLMYNYECKLTNK